MTAARPRHQRSRHARPRHDRRHPTSAQIEAPAPPWGRDVRVELAGHTVRLEELRARPERYARWFAAARRRPGHARCRCTDPGERLVIRASLAGRFHLARWPGTGNNHHLRCPFYCATDIASDDGASSGVGRDAITVTEHGMRVAVDYAFTCALPRGANDPDEPDDRDAAGLPDQWAELVRGARPATATVSGLGLLHWLFESAALNTWHPGLRPRSWADVHTALIAAVAELRLGDQPAPALCHVVAPYRPQHPDPAREARLATFLRPLEHPEHIVIRGGPRRGQTRHLRHRRLLLGEVKTLTGIAHGHQLRLRHFPRPLFMTGEQHQHLTRRFPAAFSDRRGPTARRIVLALIEASPQGYLRLVDAALMLTNECYIPAESGHEVVMADALVAAGRAFIKPLRYGGEAVFPDFVLTDTELPTIVEVWGVTGRSDYQRRREAKRAHYTAEAAALLEWTPPDPLPPLERPGPRPGGERDRRPEC